METIVMGLPCLTAPATCFAVCHKSELRDRYLRDKGSISHDHSTTADESDKNNFIESRLLRRFTLPMSMALTSWQL